VKALFFSAIQKYKCSISMHSVTLVVHTSAHRLTSIRGFNETGEDTKPHQISGVVHTKYAFVKFIRSKLNNIPVVIISYVTGSNVKMS
jgi:hypothetical protein